MQEVEESEAEANFKRERAGGNYGGGTKELQLMNFRKRQEQDKKRNGLFESGLDKFYKKDIQGVSDLLSVAGHQAEILASHSLRYIGSENPTSLKDKLSTNALHLLSLNNTSPLLATGTL